MIYLFHNNFHLITGKRSSLICSSMITENSTLDKKKDKYEKNQRSLDELLSVRIQNIAAVQVTGKNLPTASDSWTFNSTEERQGLLDKLLLVIEYGISQQFKLRAKIHQRHLTAERLTPSNIKDKYKNNQTFFDKLLLVIEYGISQLFKFRGKIRQQCLTVEHLTQLNIKISIKRTRDSLKNYRLSLNTEYCISSNYGKRFSNSIWQLNV